jgi:hypothetical protein
MEKHGIMKRGTFTTEGWPTGWHIVCNGDDSPVLTLEADGAVLLHGELNKEMTDERRRCMGLIS